MITIHSEDQSAKNCAECTKCCEGYLTGEVYGNKFYPSKACAYKAESNCAIHDSRPKLCSDYFCGWIKDDTLPYWMKPSISNIIIHPQKTETKHNNNFYAFQYIKDLANKFEPNLSNYEKTKLALKIINDYHYQMIVVCDSKNWRFENGQYFYEPK